MSRAKSSTPRREPNFRMKGPQFIIDAWGGVNAPPMEMHFTGCCYTCERRCYEMVNGSNDPRGILGDHATGASVSYARAVVRRRVQCFECNNTEPTYNAFIDSIRRMPEHDYVLVGDSIDEYAWVFKKAVAL